MAVTRQRYDAMEHNRKQKVRRQWICGNNGDNLTLCGDDNSNNSFKIVITGGESG